MPRLPTRPALACLGTLLCLAACTPEATVSVSPTATTPPAPTATPTLAPAPTPTNVPAGWKVLDTLQFSLAYPPHWTLQTYQESRAVEYRIVPPSREAQWVSVSVEELTPDLGAPAPYCTPVSDIIQHTTLAGLPMTYYVNHHIMGLPLRDWSFVTAQGTAFSLEASDVRSSSATQAQDDAILATFRPDNTDPWQCLTPTPTNVPAG